MDAPSVDRDTITVVAGAFGAGVVGAVLRWFKRRKSGGSVRPTHGEASRVDVAADARRDARLDALERAVAEHAARDDRVHDALRAADLHILESVHDDFMELARDAVAVERGRAGRDVDRGGESGDVDAGDDGPSGSPHR